MKKRVILWFRRDLRLADNPALHAALAGDFDSIVPVFIHAPDELGDEAPGGAQSVWQHFSLAALDASLQGLGSRLVIRHGPTIAALDTLIEESGARAVYWNRLYDPHTIARDRQVKRHLEDRGLETASFKALLLHEPWTVSTRQNTPYKVFTPFWKAIRDEPAGNPLPAPSRLPEVWSRLGSVALSELGLLPDIRWDERIRETWTPGEDGAHARLEAFVSKTLPEYRDSRERPARHGTSYLSAHLHFGEIGPRQVVHRVEEWLHEHGREADRTHAETFLSEIGWREFAHHVLFHFPNTPSEPLDERFKHFPWANDDEALQAWQDGRTGIPMVDAGMRELWATGYMHNRLRMTVASFLTKNLRIAWQHGERWFWDTLVDADLANNTLGWQWAAGCGADAAPFFRIFNPARQGERFDADGAYVRRWVPELAELPNKHIHEPWAAPERILDDAGVALGETYPKPIVDLKASRKEALEAFDRIKNG
ncbi:deoxyribodipyrimidine photo-lyase [Salinisphaera sp.]|uniref:cryptochrome/photolyase family protein n=1 Tax=Salinisphaera sp. TaxID=1914330 RepID=UPI002D77E499|nr:deoxyribodipyrimidine photo-lyase [Salinisphaera sp.]HET7315280.1 deoxyribodipyrimidine photo-lyase [Salinisphaera sp.]